MSENEYNLNMSDLLPRITKEDVRNRIMRMKKNTAARPDDLTKDNIEPTKKTGNHQAAIHIYHSLLHTGISLE
jgi:hypothetical protein